MMPLMLASNHYSTCNAMQTRKQSMIESVINVFIGYFVDLLSQLLIFPLFDINIAITDNAMIGLWFTAISIVRSYVVRRCFNKIH